MVIDAVDEIHEFHVIGIQNAAWQQKMLIGQFASHFC
jgi:hypothetical protein